MLKAMLWSNSNGSWAGEIGKRQIQMIRRGNGNSIVEYTRKTARKITSWSTKITNAIGDAPFTNSDTISLKCLGSVCGIVHDSCNNLPLFSRLGHCYFSSQRQRGKVLSSGSSLVSEKSVLLEKCVSPMFRTSDSEFSNSHSLSKCLLKQNQRKMFDNQIWECCFPIHVVVIYLVSKW